MMDRRGLGVLCVQETKWRGDRARMMVGGRKLLHAGGDGRSSGVGIVISEEISKEVVIVERWNGRIIMAWAMIRKQLVCVMSVYGSQTGRTEAEKQEFRDALEMMIGMVELKTLLCIARYFNAHIGETEPGEEENVGKFGWGTRNREGQALVELIARNGLAFVGSFFQKRESHKITYRSGPHKTELDLVLIRKEQLWKIKDGKAIAGEHITTQHKPVVFVVRMKRTKPNKIVSRKTIKWWKCRDEVATAYRQRVEEKYEELGEEVDNVEEEWKTYKDAFVGNAEELCGRSTGMGGKARKNQEWWTTEVASAIRENKVVWKVIGNIKVNGNQPDGGMLHLYGQKKKAAKKAVDKARNDMEADLYTKLDEDAGKKMIYKMARHRNENSKDVKEGTFIKDRNGKLVTNREEVLKVWEGHYSELLNHEGNMSDLELPNYVHEKVNVIEITDMEVTSGLKGMKKGLETLALSELHQHKLQVCENNWIRRIAGVRRAERRRMKDLREEVGTKACIVGKIVKSRMKWAGHMVRMKDEKLPKISETMKHDGCRKRRRPPLRWEDCVKRDMRKAEEEEKWREKANNRDQWKRITKVAVHRSDE